MRLNYKNILLFWFQIQPRLPTYNLYKFRRLSHLKAKTPDQLRYLIKHCTKDLNLVERLSLQVNCKPHQFTYIIYIVKRLRRLKRVDSLQVGPLKSLYSMWKKIFLGNRVQALQRLGFRETQWRNIWKHTSKSIEAACLDFRKGFYQYKSKIRYIPHFPNLKSLFIGSKSEEALDKSRILEPIKRLALSELSLDFGQILNENDFQETLLDVLKSQKNLKSFTLYIDDGCPRKAFVDIICSGLSNMENLKKFSLVLNTCKYSDNSIDLTQLRLGPNLVSLSLGVSTETELDQLDSSFFSKIPKLKRLTIDAFELSYLRASFFSDLIQLSELENLSLEYGRSDDSRDQDFSRTFIEGFQEFASKVKDRLTFLRLRVLLDKEALNCFGKGLKMLTKLRYLYISLLPPQEELYAYLPLSKALGNLESIEELTLELRWVYWQVESVEDREIQTFSQSLKALRKLNKLTLSLPHAGKSGDFVFKQVAESLWTLKRLSKLELTFYLNELEQVNEDALELVKRLRFLDELKICYEGDNAYTIPDSKFLNKEYLLGSGVISIDRYSTGYTTRMIMCPVKYSN